MRRTRTTIAYELRYDENGYAGQLTSVIEPDRTVTFAYDAAGRLWRESRSESGTAAPLVTEYAYDSTGRTSLINYPSGLSMSLDRNAAGEVQQVRTTDGTTIFAARFSFSPDQCCGITCASTG